MERQKLHEAVLKVDAILELARQAREHLASPDPDPIEVAKKLLSIRVEAREAVYIMSDVIAERV